MTVSINTSNSWTKAGDTVGVTNTVLGTLDANPWSLIVGGDNVLTFNDNTNSIDINGFQIFNGGVNALNITPTGNNVLIGGAGNNTLTSNDNVAIGIGSLVAITAPVAGIGGNVSIGFQSMQHATTPTWCVSIGYQALQSATTSNRGDVAIGFKALQSSHSPSIGNALNVAVGGAAGFFVTTGCQNVFMGGGSGQGVTTGINNTCIGDDAGPGTVNGDNNTIVGAASLADFGGNNNSVCGGNTLVLADGDNNSALGANAGSTQTGFSTCTFLGAATDMTGVYANITAIGYAASATASNQIMLGNSSVTDIAVASNGTCNLGSASLPLGTIYCNNIVGPSGLPYVDQASTPVTMNINTTYGNNNGSTLVVYALPTTFAIGSVFEIVGFSTGLWEITQSAGQQIFMDSKFTTLGAGGLLVSNTRGGSVKLRAVVANTTLVVTSSEGSLTLS